MAVVGGGVVEEVAQEVEEVKENLHPLGFSLK
jgi:hypothetical protein